MYCVIGEKVLKCDVVEKLESYSWCRIGSSTKNLSIPNAKLFKTEQEGKNYIAKKEQYKNDREKQIINEVVVCNELYDNLYKETGINIRVIDRRWKAKEVKIQIDRLMKKHINKNKKADGSTETRIDAKSEGRPGAASGEKPKGRQEGKPWSKPARRADRRAEFKPEGRSEGKSGFKSEGRPERKSGFKPEGRPEGKSGFKSEGRPERKSGFKSEGRPERKSGFKPEGRPQGKIWSKPEGKSGAKSGSKTGTKK